GGSENALDRQTRRVSLRQFGTGGTYAQVWILFRASKHLAHLGKSEEQPQKIVHRPRLDQSAVYPARYCLRGSTKPLRQCLLLEAKMLDPLPYLGGCEQMEVRAQGIADSLIDGTGDDCLTAGLAAGNLQRGEVEFVNDPVLLDLCRMIDDGR